jgi:hypothetical protein
MRIATWLCVAGFFVSFAGMPPSPAPCDAPPWWNWLYDGGWILTITFFYTPILAGSAYGIGAHHAARVLMFTPIFALCFYLAAIAFTYVDSRTTLFCYLLRPG